MNFHDSLMVALKGFGMGAANVVPGVSGGTIALLTGIYNQIVDSLAAFTNKETWKSLLHGQWKRFWEDINGGFLLALGIGVVVSIFSLAKLMTWALSHYPILTWAFFFGLIIASVFYMLKDVRNWRAKDVLVMIVGIILGVVICTLSPTQTPDDMWFIFICAAIAICTMILPGISGSFILVILGKYDYIMQAVSDLNWPVLIVFALGCAVGLLAFARLLQWLLSRWERETMLVLIGFVIGSLIRVWPWADKDAIMEAQALRAGIGEQSAGSVGDILDSLPEKIDSLQTMDPQIAGAIICCLIGIALVVVLESLGKKKEVRKDTSLGANLQ